MVVDDEGLARERVKRMLEAQRAYEDGQKAYGRAPCGYRKRSPKVAEARTVAASAAGAGSDHPVEFRFRSRPLAPSKAEPAARPSALPSTSLSDAS